MRAPHRIAALACAIACGADPSPPETIPSEADPSPANLAIAAGEDPTRDVVLARIGSEALPAIAQPALAAAPRKLDVLTRNAVSGALPFEVRVPAAATRLRWSQACVASHAARAEAVGFRIELRSDDNPWQPLHAGEIAPGSGWHDHSLDLPETQAASRELRFATELPGGASGCEPLWGSALLLGPGGADARPNVVLISLDTLGAASLGSFSGAAEVSPELDAFLSDGSSFRRAYAQYGNTLVSHASLFSALYPRHHGVYPGGLPTLLPSSLVEIFSAAGYRTTAITEGAFVSAAFGFARGFDHYHDGAIGLSHQMAGGAETTFERAAAWLESSGRTERFFLFLHTYEVHSPYLPGDEDAMRIAAQLTPGDARVPSREVQARQLLLHNAGRARLSPRDLSRLEALHVGEVHGLDAIVGRFLARLDAAGLAQHTLVVITSDHGDQFGEGGKVGHGDSLHDRVLHVPLGFRWPGVIARRSIEAPVQLVDVLPTLLELAGLPAPESLDGVSLAPLLTKGTRAPARPAFSEQRSARGECARLGRELGCRLDRLAVHAGRWKLVTSLLPPWRRLYDLSTDPLEQRDVYDAHPEQAARLSSLLDAYLLDSSHDGASPDSASAEIDADTRERLRDLGYAAPVEAF